MSLTVKKVAQLISKGRYLDERGLYLQVKSSSSRCWILRYEANGRERWMGLGSAKDFGLGEARNRARSARQKLADGIDPLDDRQAKRQEAAAARQRAQARQITFEVAAHQYYEQHSSKWKNAKHHHLRKTGGEAGTVEDGRGASALLAAARSARVINVMTKKEAEDANIDERERRFHIRADLGKANLTPPAAHADWYKLVSIDLQNTEGTDWDEGDRVAAIAPFQYPKVDAPIMTPTVIGRVLAKVASDGPWRENAQSVAEPWVGVAIARELGLDLQSKTEKRRISRLIREWIAAGFLAIETREDAHRERRRYVVPGPNAPE